MAVAASNIKTTPSGNRKLFVTLSKGAYGQETIALVCPLPMKKVREDLIEHEDLTGRVSVYAVQEFLLHMSTIQQSILILDELYPDQDSRVRATCKDRYGRDFMSMGTMSLMTIPGGSPVSSVDSSPDQKETTMSGNDVDRLKVLREIIDDMYGRKDLDELQKVYDYLESTFDSLITAEGNKGTHVDALTYNSSLPEFVRWWIVVNRLPAMLRMVAGSVAPVPPLYASYLGARVRVTMASRMGDVGITKHLDQESGYETRVAMLDLTNFSNQPVEIG